MADTIVKKSRVKLARKSEADLYAVKDSLVLMHGEVLLVDTEDGDVRQKIGDGVKTYAELPFIDQKVIDMASGIIVQGYYFNGSFYTNVTHTISVIPYEYKIYVDKITRNAYVYDNDDAAYHCVSNPVATSTSAGVMKLYNSTGNNTDGTMTQGSITTEIGKKFSIRAGEDEGLIFTNGIN